MLTGKDSKKILNRLHIFGSKALDKNKTAEKSTEEKMEISILPDEITLIPAPDIITENTPPAVPENPEIKTNENLSIETAINNTIKEKDLSIPKNITHAFKCDESESNG